VFRACIYVKHRSREKRSQSVRRLADRAQDGAWQSSGTSADRSALEYPKSIAVRLSKKKNPAALAHRGVFHHLLGVNSDRLPATAAATAAARSARTTAAAATTAATAALTFLSFVNTQRTTAHILAVQGLDGALRIGARHLDKAKATRTTRFAIVNQRDGFNSAVLFEQLADLCFVSRKRQVTHIDFRHSNTVSL
jgi:hypothetical protein